MRYQIVGGLTQPDYLLRLGIGHGALGIGYGKMRGMREKD
jgi:hypothetical protein